MTCLGGELPPADLSEYPSHVETLGFVAPRNSSQTAITATEAYYMLKFGGESGRAVESWTDPTSSWCAIPVRAPSSPLEPTWEFLVPLGVANSRDTTGVATVDGLNVATSVVETGNMPACAMHGKREVSGADISLFEHPAPCDCLFLESNGVASGCATCDE